ncbi:hypothetical protein J3E72DRAFT_298438 [Bipolaris maydis]|uniref:uncharacterized protein n=1 Tax=Cochliobolus heterostrophus TaxID=5016 RepID=UPI0024DD3BDC|nr:hypothetical protein J3E73DRAFT_276822 [Bipolaris maydis]KAJ5065453.1 hypothetical protein J3E74DRAFT_302072 [Bipolaris maydis]KAJ6200665.1 hypothetical protein J3E72DRAFT_298438 [Bipolaris maydis]KAJ6213491.1 hypothetical protein PSV09DRAFT_2277476 [Bipolaris maydis]KAJ6274715.1 hypothetical protein PSV08DRAFT_266826 [Bipolaris maydis]
MFFFFSLFIFFVLSFFFQEHLIVRTVSLVSPAPHTSSGVYYLLSVYLLFDTKSRGKCNQPTNPASAHLASVSGWATKEACFGLWNGGGQYGDWEVLFVRRSVC